MACGDKVALRGIANGLNFGFGDIHVKSPDRNIVVEEIECGLDVLRVFTLNTYVIYEDMLC